MQHVSAGRKQLVWNGLAVVILLIVMGLSAGAWPSAVPSGAVVPDSTGPAAAVTPATQAPAPLPEPPIQPVSAAHQPVPSAAVQPVQPSRPSAQPPTRDDFLPGSGPAAGRFLLEHRLQRQTLAARPPSTIKVPILMYHEIADGPNRLYIPPAEFAAHVAALKQLGFTTVRLQELYDHYTYGAPLPDRPIILTFDDGYASFYSHAYPLLKRNGFTGTLFVITGWVGRPGYVTWDQVREMATDGVEMGAHTVSHLELPRLSSGDASWEAAESRRRLEREIGRTVPFFAYPAGRNDARSVATVKEAGFLGAVTTEYGLATARQDPLRWQRVRIDNGMTGAQLEAQLKILLIE